MKAFLLFAFLTLFTSLAYSQTWVDGYTKDNGTYVQGYYRSNSNNTTLDNYSTRGNVNPYTNESGYKDPFQTSRRSTSSDWNNSSSNSTWNNSSLYNSNDVKVKSYFRDNGTEVESHYRTRPNNTIWDNYSTEGNVNPYTGKKGHKKGN